MTFGSRASELRIPKRREAADPDDPRGHHGSLELKLVFQDQDGTIKGQDEDQTF